MPGPQPPDWLLSESRHAIGPAMVRPAAGRICEWTGLDPSACFGVLCSDTRSLAIKTKVWISPSVRTAVPAIKDACFLCLINENHFNLSARMGVGGGPGGGGLDSKSDVNKYSHIASLVQVTGHIAC